MPACSELERAEAVLALAAATEKATATPALARRREPGLAPVALIYWTEEAFTLSSRATEESNAIWTTTNWKALASQPPRLTVALTTYELGAGAAG